MWLYSNHLIERLFIHSSIYYASFFPHHIILYFVIQINFIRMKTVYSYTIFGSISSINGCWSSNYKYIRNTFELSFHFMIWAANNLILRRSHLVVEASATSHIYINLIIPYRKQFYISFWVDVVRRRLHNNAARENRTENQRKANTHTKERQHKKKKLNYPKSLLKWMIIGFVSQYRDWGNLLKLDSIKALLYRSR